MIGTEDYTVNYPENPKVGVVIETYGSIPYVELQLYFLKYGNKIDNILIYDDYSPYQNELKALANQYKVDFYSTPKRMWYKDGVGSIGSTNAFYQGLLWAKKNKLDILIKLSRHLLACYEWKQDLISLAEKSDANTFTSYCSKGPYHFRTECIALNVETWTRKYPLSAMQFTIQNELPIFAEFWFHELAKTIAGNNYSEKWDKYQKEKKYGYLYSGYAMWQDLLGTNRYTNENRHANVLWHQYSKPEEYYNVSKAILKDKYSLTDFNLT